jgi:hypothetical protein
MSNLPPAVLEDIFATNEAGFWHLIRFEAEHESERVDYYDQLDELERERRKRERAERVRNLPPPEPGRLTLSDALARLERVRRAGDERWTARCPVHEDRSPSLVVEERRERPGEPHFYCYAGCDWRAVVAELKR